MGVSNIYVGKEDNSYFIDTQCDEEHLDQICDCNTIALVESKQEAIQIGIRESKKLRVPLMIEWELTENMNANNEKEAAEDIYERLLNSQISYMIFEDPLEHYTHLTDQEKQKVKDYMMDDTYLWDFAPIAEFIYDNIPSTFQEQNYPKLGVVFRKELYTEGLYSDKMQYRLYQHYLLNFDYGMGNTPVCLDEFIINELESEDYLDSIDGMEL